MKNRLSTWGEWICFIVSRGVKRPRYCVIVVFSKGCHVITVITLKWCRENKASISFPFSLLLSAVSLSVLVFFASPPRLTLHHRLSLPPSSFWHLLWHYGGWRFVKMQLQIDEAAEWTSLRCGICKMWHRWMFLKETPGHFRPCFWRSKVVFFLS